MSDRERSESGLRKEERGFPVKVEHMELGPIEILLIVLGNLLILGAAFAAVAVVVRSITSKPANDRTFQSSGTYLCGKCGHTLPPKADVCSVCGAKASRTDADSELTRPPQG